MDVGVNLLLGVLNISGAVMFFRLHRRGEWQPRPGHWLNARSMAVFCLLAAAICFIDAAR